MAPAWTELTTTGGVSEGFDLAGSVLALDTVRDRLLRAGFFENELWELPLAGAGPLHQGGVWFAKISSRAFHASVSRHADETPRGGEG